jgi:hypothetical protein
MEPSRETRLLALLDTLPKDVIIQHIRPRLAPESLVWLSRSNYMAHHATTIPMLRERPCARFPLGRWETYVRHMIRDDCSFVVQQLLRDNAHKWVRRRNYRYRHNTYPTYLHFMWEYSGEFTASRSRRLILDAGAELIGGNWYKRRRDRSTRWTN